MFRLMTLTFLVLPVVGFSGDGILGCFQRIGNYSNLSTPDDRVGGRYGESSNVQSQKLVTEDSTGRDYGTNGPTSRKVADEENQIDKKITVKTISGLSSTNSSASVIGDASEEPLGFQVIVNSMRRKLNKARLPKGWSNKKGYEKF